MIDVTRSMGGHDCAMPQTEARPHPRAKDTLFGRERELRRLESDLFEVQGGAARVSVVSGESGVGKTSLVLSMVDDIEAWVLTGHCLPLEGEAIPFAPLIGALRRLSQDLEPEQHERLIASWPAEFQALRPPASGPRASPAEHTDPSAETVLSSSSQARLFEGLLSMLSELARDRMVVWVIEDIHWADRSTLDLIAFLARSLGPDKVLIVITARTDDLDRRHPLRRWIAELDRLPSVSRVELDRLSREATRRQIRRLAAETATTVDQATIDAIFHRSDGNPLFTEQLLPWTEGDPAALPVTLHDLVSSRLHTLPREVFSLLEVAAVLGREFDAELLAAVAGRTELEIEAGLEVAVDHQLVRFGPGIGYSFAHPIYREILETDMLPGRRRRLHGSAAEQMSRSGGSTDLEYEAIGKIAHHWELAEASEPAFAATVRAGLLAERMCAVAEADEYFTKAVALGERAGAPLYEEAGTTKVDLLLHSAQAAHLVGDGPRAVEIIDRAVQLCPDAQSRSEALERKGAYCFNAGLGEEAEAAYREAVDLLPPGPSVARARVLSGIGLLAMAWTRMGEAERACREAIDVARELGARREEGRALNALGVVTAYRGAFDEAIGYSRESVAIAADLDNPDDLATAYIDLTHVLGLAGRCDESLEVLREGYAAMDAAGLLRQDGSFLQANVAESLVDAGRWEEAQDLLDEAMAQRSLGLRAFPVLEHAAKLRIRRGELERAEELLSQARCLVEEFGAPDAWRRELLEVDAEFHLWAGDPAAALASAESGLALVSGGDETRFAGLLVALASRALADAAEAARADQDRQALRRCREAAAGLRQRASEMVPSPLDGERHPLLEGRANELTIRAELTRCETATDAADLWSDAAAAWAEVSRPFQAAYARWREAEALVLAKRPGQGPVTAVRAAHAAALELGAGRLAAEIEVVAGYGRIDLLEEPGEEQVAQPMADLGLTRREEEVLERLVRGETNREIAASLFISVKTASVHVSNILRKLGVNSREEAARIAYRRQSTVDLPRPRDPEP
jgi:DNA-binding CsgD family transcriptional regulator/tetratricopeptide (TPR) repeat protein